MRQHNEITGLSGEEEKFLAIAIKNSLREQQADEFIELNEIEEMKTFRYEKFISQAYFLPPFGISTKNSRIDQNRGFG